MSALLKSSMGVAASSAKPKLASGVHNFEMHTCYRLGRCSADEVTGENALRYDESRQVDLSTTIIVMGMIRSSAGTRRVIRSGLRGD